MMKKIICLLIVLTLCLSAMPVLASEEEPSLMDQVQELLDAEDYDTAIPILQEAADNGDAEAQNKLGTCYIYGWGVDQDYDEAVKYIRLAADQGFAKGQSNLGSCYFYGNGVEQDYEEAVKYYQMAAEQGDAEAQFNLGYMY